MSGSRLNPAERRYTEADEHLGDRLAALVDGELGHDARERVLSHLATCPQCKAEADAQRRLKSVFSQTAPPPPSESFLARLQGLPGGSDGDTPFGGGPGFGSGRPLGGVRGFGQGVFDVDAEQFAYAPAGAGAAVLPSAERGFRIHEVGRSDGAASRGRRFAFAAAGAVSLAAIALGGVSGVPADTGDPRGGTGSNVTPLRSQTTGSTPASEAQRRRSSNAPLFAGQSGGALAAPVSPVSASAPLLPGGGHGDTVTPYSTAPLLTGSPRMAPLIRPTQPLPVLSVALPAHTPAADPPPGTTQVQAGPATAR